MAKHIPRGKRELYQDHYLKEAGLSRYKDMPSHEVFNSPEELALEGLVGRQDMV
jgi:leucyl aminopeptidase (aminopeptidase T)